MKIFALYLRLDLTIQPDWFDRIWKKYSSTSILHITLIQTRYIDDNQIEDLKKKVTKVINETEFKPEDKRVIFDKTTVEMEDEKHSLFMWFIKRNQSIIELQRRLLDELKVYNNYCTEVTKEYEILFRPHITVADRIVDQVEINNLISQGEKCEGVVKDLVLAIVKNRTIEESENSNNWTVLSF